MSDQQMASPEMQPLNAVSRRSTKVFNVGAMRRVPEPILEQEEHDYENE